MGCQSCCGTNAIKDCKFDPGIAGDGERRPEVREFIDDINCRLDTLLGSMDELRCRLDSVLRQVPEDGKCDSQLIKKRTSTCQLGHQLNDICDRIDAIQYGIKMTLDRLEV